MYAAGGSEESWHLSMSIFLDQVEITTKLVPSVHPVCCIFKYSASIQAAHFLESQSTRLGRSPLRPLQAFLETRIGQEAKWTGRFTLTRSYGASR